MCPKETNAHIRLIELVNTLEILQQKCNRDIQIKNKTRVFPYMREYNSNLEAIKELYPNIGDEFQPIKENFFGLMVDTEDERLRIMTKVDFMSTKLLVALRIELTKYESSRSSENEFDFVFNIMHIHPKIVEASKGLFLDGYYSQAIFEAFKAVEIDVKEKSGLDMSGTKLISQAFSGEKPIIRLNSLQSQSEKDEQEGFMHLFMGSMQGIRNPKGHECVSKIDPARALEYLALASLLLKIIDFWE
jgi:uncharacterized protein (TIGR02391 family)